MTTDISEKGLETLIMVQITGTEQPAAPVPEDVLPEMPFLSTGNGWFAGNPRDGDRARELDVPQLFRFLDYPGRKNSRSSASPTPQMSKTLPVSSFWQGFPIRSAGAA